MMKQAPLWAAAAMAAALSLAPAVSAATFLFDVTDSSGTVLSGQFTASGPTLTSTYGSGQAVTALAAALDAGAAGFSPTGAATLIADPGGVARTSPSGSFIYDDLYDTTAGFTTGGLLFTVGGTEFNLFNNGDGTYTLYEQLTHGGPGTNETVSLAVSAATVPEVGTWTLMLLGVAGLGGAIRSRARRQATA